MAYVDPTTVHVPVSGAVPPAAWGAVVNADLNDLYAEVIAAQSTATTAAANALNATKKTDMGNTSPIDGGTVGAGPWLFKAGINTATVDGAGDIAIDFGTNFPNGLISVTATLVLSAGTINVLAAAVAVWAASLDLFKARIYNPSTGVSYTSGTAGVSWIAVGW